MNLAQVIPKELQKRRQWVLYNGPDKIPQNLKGQAKVNEPSTWLRFRDCYTVVDGKIFGGLGFVFTKNDIYCGIDLDDCFVDGKLSETAKDILGMFPDAYIEWSMSKTGLHIIVGGSKTPGIGCKMYPKEEGFPNQVVEVYDQGRYFALTGDLYGETFNGRIPLKQKALEEFFQKYFPVPSKEEANPVQASILTDEEILAIVSRAKNKEKFTRLMNGETTGYASTSEAELALCGILAFYTQEPSQLKRLLRSSGMNREKLLREDYLDRTINKALQNLGEVYTPPAKREIDGLDRVQEFLETAKKGQATVDVIYEPAMIGAFASLPEAKLLQAKANLRTAFGRKFLATEFNRALKLERKKEQGETPKERTLEFEGMQHLKQPSGFLVNDYGVHEYVEGPEEDALVRIAPAPLVIRSIIEDHATQHTFFELAWLRNNQWITGTLARNEALNCKDLLMIAKRGAPIDGSLSYSLVKYLHAFEMTNLDTLDFRKRVTSLGWNQGFFQLGQRALGTKDEVVFSHKGQEDLAQGYVSSGTFEGWKALVEKTYAFPHAMVLLCASMAAPLLQLVDCPNFFVDVAYSTSTGKTTAQRLAASVWGVPDTRSPNSLVHSWNATKVGVESLAGCLNSLPLFLDDTATAKHQGDIESMVYMLQQGVSKVRGDKQGGTQERNHFHTIVVSTGESRLSQLTQQGGAAARILSFWGAPFHGVQEKLVREINRGVVLHHGTAGEKLIHHVLTKNPEELRATWISISAKLQGQAPKEGVISRLADFFALLMMGRLVANEALGLSIPELLPLWKTLHLDYQVADKAKEALERVFSWAVANQRQFFGRNTGERPSGNEGWAGRWTDGTMEISFLTERFRELVTSMGYNPKAILELWRERGWLRALPGRLNVSTRIEKQVVCVYALSQAAIDLMTEGTVKA